MIKMKEKRGRPKLFKSKIDLEKKIDEYFNICDLKEEPYTVTGLALMLDIDRKTLNNYSKNEEYFPTIKKAKLKIENDLEKRLLTANGVTTGVIFNLKNNYGWKDKIDNINVSTSYEDYMKKVEDEDEY